MAAFGTKKTGGDEAVQLTFPGVFSAAYKKGRLGVRFAPTEIHHSVQDYVGDDFQAQYQRSKRAEAHKMAMNGVEATQAARNRAFSSHAGYYGMPEPVLSQRIRGSNFGVGGGGSLGYGHADAAVGLTGGVLGTREGRSFAMNRLKARKAQLDAIDASELEGPTLQAQVDAGAPADFSETARLELGSFLTQLRDQIASERTEFSPDIFRRFVSLYIRFMNTCTQEEYDDILERLDEIIELLAAKLGGRYEDEEEDAKGSYDRSMAEYLSRLRRYTVAMARGLTMQPKDRRALSKSALKSSGMSAIGTSESDLPYAEADDGVGADGSASRGRSSTTSGSTRYFGDDDSEGGPGGFGPLLPGRTRGAAGRYAFDRPGLSYEISSGPAGGAAFSASVRDRFGRQGMAGEARRARAFYGEGDEEAGEEDLEADAAEAGAAVAAAPGLRVGELDEEGDAYERLRAQAEAGEDEEEDEEEAGEEAEAAPERDVAGYWANWTAQGFRIPSAEYTKFFATEFSDEASAEAKLMTLTAKSLRMLANTLRRARAQEGGRLYLLTTDNTYALRKALREELNRIFG